ncbi:hypothetical protein ULMA_10620 [Patiriisocius marinus]|uniref:Uncharacterized protein n=1 Tax=Patiriisocius marinus TaxID=1397112 RepID=A0A5J4IVP2_9FLAO|nr:hypothetical protein ULMA_10620 [Patiriisocius marinus]
MIASVSCKEKQTEISTNAVNDIVQVVYPLVNPIKENSATPRLFSSDSKLFMSWVFKMEEVAHLEFAAFDGKMWNSPFIVSKGKDWFNNWADFPTITESNKNILTTYLQKSAADTYTYDIKVNVYDDSLKKWKKNILLHTDGTKSEHGFVSTSSDEKGGFFVSWLDGRNTAGGGHHNEGHSTDGAMTLRTAHISAKGIISNEHEVDSRVCDCCGTSMATLSSGPVVVYRDRSEDEIRDISISRNINGVWTQPQSIYKDNWKISGCPVNGPTVSAFEESLAVAWFTGVNEKNKVQLIFSEDGGETFGLPIRIDTNLTLGRVDVVMLSKNEAVVSWMEQVDDETLIQLMKVNSNGSKGEVITLSNTSAERASGFPQIELFENKIFAAMTITSKDKPSTIKTVSVNIEDL